ncbi:MAG: hypothetical protein ACRDRC_16255, partial [Pseudonocardiaceae bacterium]
MGRSPALVRPPEAVADHDKCNHLRHEPFADCRCQHPDRGAALLSKQMAARVRLGPRPRHRVLPMDPSMPRLAVTATGAGEQVKQFAVDLVPHHAGEGSAAAGSPAAGAASA